MTRTDRIAQLRADKGDGFYLTGETKPLAIGWAVLCAANPPKGKRVMLGKIKQHAK
jgi:hypothetical protein